jgi:hypothetical protein
LRYEKRGEIILSRNGRKTGKKYVIKQWDGVSLIENPNQKSARNSSIGIYWDSTLLSKTMLTKGKTSPQAGSRLNFGGALVFGSFPGQPLPQIPAL